MRHPEYMVTGLPGSGTTFLMELLRELGYDLGRPLWSRNERKGLEWAPLRRVMLSVERWLEARETFASPELLAQAGVRWEPIIQNLNCPPAVKAVGMYHGAGVILRYVRPRHIFIMVRNMEDWVQAQVLEAEHRAMTSTLLMVPGPPARVHIRNQGALLLGLLLESVVKSRIPFTILDYPRVVRDRGYTLEATAAANLWSVDQRAFVDAHRRAAKPFLVGWTKKNLPETMREAGFVSPYVEVPIA